MRSVALDLAAIGVGNQARDRPAVARDDDGLATLNCIEQTREVGFGVRGPNLTHRRLISTGRFRLVDMR